MKPKRKLKVYSYQPSMSVAVGYEGERSAVAWFWDTINEDALKNAREYVAWKNRRSK